MKFPHKETIYSSATKYIYRIDKETVSIPRALEKILGRPIVSTREGSIIKQIFHYQDLTLELIEEDEPNNYNLSLSAYYSRLKQKPKIKRFKKILDKKF